MKEEVHIFQGLKRDNHELRLKSEFLWDAHNIRLTNREDDTLLAITNEKGTLNTQNRFTGSYVGHCIVGKYLVIFTAKDDKSDCYIYRVEKEGSEYKVVILFHEPDVWGEGWTPEHPIETIGVYETELVLKVYWVDGINQPRVINITKPELKIKDAFLITDLINFSKTYKVEDLPSYYPIRDDDRDLRLSDILNEGPLYNKDSFNFIRELQLKEEVEVFKGYDNGVFSPGTILYAFSYFEKYGSESNICYTTPLYYISPRDRGGNPEEKVKCSFTINIRQPDINFDYIRLYSIHRTSIDALPTVKVVEDIFIDNRQEIQYTDYGTTGYIVDPSLLLYIGGRTIVPKTICQRDNTLFFGNYGLKSSNTFLDINNIIDKLESEFQPISKALVTSNFKEGEYYNYTPNLSNANSAGFKTYETYRCGVLVLFKNGEWSEPIFIKDTILNGVYPWAEDGRRYYSKVQLSAKGDDKKIGEELLNKGVKKIRSCIVFPKLSKIERLCLGVLCPTMKRLKNNEWEFSSSWFFRSAVKEDPDNPYKGSNIPFMHNDFIEAAGQRSAEIQGLIRLSETDGFLLDENIVTFHSPDIEFGSYNNVDFENTKLRIIGIANLGSIYGDIDIMTSTSSTDNNTRWDNIPHMIGYTMGDGRATNGGLVSGLFYRGSTIQKTRDGNKYKEKSGSPVLWMVYPWHRSGSLNNDKARPANTGTRTDVLLKKKISNLKFFDNNSSLGTRNNLPLEFEYTISSPQLFNSNELLLTKVDTPFFKTSLNYLGNLDYLYVPSSDSNYSIYFGNDFAGALNIPGGESTEGDDTFYDISSGNDPVRIKYKSTPHLVFSLHNTDRTKILLLPSHKSIIENSDSDIYTEEYTPLDSEVLPDYNSLAYGTLDLYTNYAFNTTSPLSLDKIGKYGIGRFVSNADHETLLPYTLAIVGTAGRHPAWVSKSTPEEGLILRAQGCRFYGDINNEEDRLPGTEASDYTTDSKTDTLVLNIPKYYKIFNNRNIDRPENSTLIGKDTDGGYLYIVDVTLEIKNTDLSNINYTLQRDLFGNENSNIEYPYLLIGELVREVPDKFDEDGETGTDNMWFPSSKPIKIVGDEKNIEIPYEYGDTFYSRYDCLKTYPFTQEDENQVIEIGSFLCETRFNIDGRYDRNRGLLSNLNTTPLNFNLMNEVYSQKDNFFNYRKLDSDYYKLDSFPNQVIWTKEKLPGELVDTWTNMTAASTLNIEGPDAITSLKSWDKWLVCFKEKSIHRLLFNVRALIAASDGVPIEISNGRKMEGSQEIVKGIGLTNKWSAIETPAGIYFYDNNTNGIYLFNGLLTNLTKDRGMSQWAKLSFTTLPWLPTWTEENTLNGFRTFYDARYGDVYFTPGLVYGDKIEQPDALCFSEHLGLFTSLYSYGGVSAMFNFDNDFYSLKEDGVESIELHKNNAGDYNNFFGETKGWDFSFISNDNPLYTKIFDTISLRADLYDNNDNLLYDFPGNYIEVNNEYQKANTVIDNKNMRKKFRIWRGLIPRNNGTRERIRNPWTKIKIGWNPELADTNSKTNKAIIHDVAVKYTI